MKKLPLYLIDAIRAFERGKPLRAVMGEEFSKAYIKLKMQEWDCFSCQLTGWEREHTLDC